MRHLVIASAAALIAAGLIFGFVWVIVHGAKSDCRYYGKYTHQRTEFHASDFSCYVHTPQGIFQKGQIRSR